jgi:Zn-dependent protease with chaperone function
MVQADYCNGRSTRVRAVELSVTGADLLVRGEDVELRVPFSRVRVDEQLGRAPRRLHLDDGAFCEVHDLQALNTLLALTPHRDGWVDRMQRHGAVVVGACVLCVMMTIAGYRWGLPWLAAKGARHLSPTIGSALSAQALRALDGGILRPSLIPETRRQGIAAAFHAMRLPEGGTPGSALLFRRSQQLGANAFTLPDGTIIVLDGLLTAIGDDRRILAVLAHELGHAHGHHGLQILLQGSAVGAFLTFYVGDISPLLAAAPAAVVQSRYSQQLEWQADDYAAALLLHNGLSPDLLADALTELAALHPELSKGGYLASHPSTDERLRHLRMLAASSTAR